MTTYYPEQSFVSPLATISRERMLSVQGTVRAHLGRQVAASDTVAAAEIMSDRVIVEVADLLGVPADEIGDYLNVFVDDAVEAGQVIAQKKGFLGGKVVRAPIDGMVTVSEGGRLVLEGAPDIVELKAAMPGTVTHVVEGFGVQLQTVGALIQGVWGAGGVSTGALQVIGTEFGAGDVLPPGVITLDQRGAILLSRVPVSEEFLLKADEQRVRGLIIPGMRAALTDVARSLDGVAVVLTEGFGHRMMADEVFELIGANAGREVVLIGQEPSRWSTARPEIIIPIDFPGEMPKALDVGAALEVGRRVRLLRDPYAGEIGEVTALPAEPQPVENGLATLGARVRLGARREVFVPLANLEMIG
jgi:hypothetical protein